MKVLYDYQCFNQQFGGVSIFFAELWNRLPNDITPLLPHIISDNIYLSDMKGVNYYHFPKKRSKAKLNAAKFINQIISKYTLTKGNYDIFHPTFLNSYYVESVPKGKIVISTQHDFIYEKTERPDSEVVKKRRLKQLKHSDIVVCVSNQTRDDLLHYYDFMDESQVKVIYQGIKRTDVICLDKPLFEFPYILYVGGRTTYKNFDRFITAFSKLDKSIHLVCTGKPFDKDEIIVLKKLGISERCHQLFASEKDFDNLYCNALAFIYPSTMEGFGLPTLDAFSAGCPAIISDIPCFKEVGGEAAVYFDPLDIDSIYKTIDDTISSNSTLQEMKKKGKDRAKMFTWEKNANEYSELYKSLV